MRIACLSDAVRIGVGAFAGAGLLLTASGCLATRGWVDDQLRPITGQQERFETQLNNLHLERRLVLDSSAGPTFAFAVIGDTGRFVQLTDRTSWRCRIAKGRQWLVARPA